MNLVTRTTEYPTGVKITETFESTSEVPYDQAAEETEEAHDEPYVVTFVYHGKYREVQNPQIVQGRWNGFNGYNALLGGVELQSGQYKNFNLSEISPVV